MNFDKIINPVTNKSFSIYSKEGRTLLKNMILSSKGGSQSQSQLPPTPPP